MKITLKDPSKHIENCSLNNLTELSLPQEKKGNTYFHEERWKNLDSESGIYVLWWTGKTQDLLKKRLLNSN